MADDPMLRAIPKISSRGRYYLDWEPPMPSVLLDIEIFSAGSLLVLRRKRDNEARHLTGMLTDPPRMFVKIHDEEHDETRFEPISWAIAKALAPDETRALGEYVAAARDKERPAAATKDVG